MKKSLLILALILSLAMVLAPAVLAADLDPVTDAADILAYDEWTNLNERALAISRQYECLVAIFIVDDMGNYDFDDAYTFNLDTYSEYYFGPEADKGCLLLTLSLRNRDCWLEPYGDAKKAFTEHGIDVMLNRHVLPLLKKNQYIEAISTYLDTAEEYLKMAREGAPFDTGNDSGRDAPRQDTSKRLAITILAPLLISLLICLVWKSQMKSARKARHADAYIPDGGFDLTVQEDRFLYRTSVRRKIQRSNTSSSSRGGSSHSSSHGSSGGSSSGSSGRGGKF